MWGLRKNILIDCKSSKMAAHRGDQSLIRMSLLRCLLLLTVSAALCQAEAGCEVEVDDQHVNITCNEITDFSAVTSALTSEDQKVIQLKIVSSPQLVIQRADLDNPAFQELEKFHWTKSEKTSFDPAPFQGLAKLNTLELRDNIIESISADNFAGLTNLKELSLGENNLVSIEAGAFKVLPNLEHLRLDNNLLTSIPSGLFEGTKLVSLDLTSNELTSIEEGSLLGLTNLRYLDLSVNNIKTIDSRAFQTLDQLKIVELVLNNLEGIDSRLFENNPLAILNLENNNLENIENVHFNSTSLVGLNLSKCKIQSLPAAFFDNLPALKALSLRDNHISTIESGVFTALSNLLMLNLNENKLSSLSVSSFSQLQNIAKVAARNETLEVGGIIDLTSKLLLQNNPWHCSSSDMTELRAWCEQNEIVFDDLFNCNYIPSPVLSAEPVIVVQHT